MTSEWRLAARAAIQKAIAAAPSDDLAVIKKCIDAAYPFGERENHPYKMWLKERKLCFQELGIIPPETKKECDLCDRTPPGQLSLF